MIAVVVATVILCACAASVFGSDDSDDDAPPTEEAFPRHVVRQPGIPLPASPDNMWVGRAVGFVIGLLACWFAWELFK